MKQTVAIFKRNKNEHGTKNQGVDRKTKRRLKREQKERDKHLFVRDNDLRDVVSHGGYHFYSNYFTYGQRFGRILTLVESPQADRDLPPFWHIKLIPHSYILNDDPNEKSPDAVFGAHGQLFDMLENKPKSWASDHQAKADTNAQMEGDDVTSSDQAQRVSTTRQDNRIIASDRAAGDMYGATEFKILLTAWSLKDLDTATFRYRQNISLRFNGTHFEIYEGQQKDDFHNLLRTADVQIGNHPMNTSSEHAGGYEILTRGVTDPNGDYIGQMVGDVNNTAVLMDLDNYDHHVVVAHSAQPQMLRISLNEFDDGTRASTLMGVRLAQSALINNHRVIHMVLNGAKPQNIGADLSDITTVVSLNGGDHQGAINPFEIFGSDIRKSKQYQYYPAHIQKIRLMIKQITPSTDDVDLGEVLSGLLKKFYQDQDMLPINPQENYKDLKLVGLPHDQYPILRDFLKYIDARMNRTKNAATSARLERLHSAFNTMYEENQDIFDVRTNEDVDSANQSPQVVYDFSSLRRRGDGVAMAQFINALRYATDSLSARDVLIIHGTDNLSDSVKDYVKSVFDDLNQRGIRLVYLYDDTSNCLDDSEFNRLTFADWRMLGGFNAPVLKKYHDIIQRDIPKALGKSIIDFSTGEYGDSIYYLSRGIDNVLFALDMNLGTRHGDQLSEHPRGLAVSSAQR